MVHQKFTLQKIVSQRLINQYSRSLIPSNFLFPLSVTFGPKNPIISVKNFLTPLVLYEVVYLIEQHQIS